MSNCPCPKATSVSNLKKTSINLLDQTEDQTCPAVGYQPATVCVPVTVT